jgi:hypothetical protein
MNPQYYVVVAQLLPSTTARSSKCSVLGTHSLFSLLQSAGCDPHKSNESTNDSENTSLQWDSSAVRGVLAEAFGFITSEQLESSAVTGVFTEVPGIDAEDASKVDWGSEDDFSDDSYEEDDDSDVEPFTEMYPAAKLVSFKLKNPSSAVKQKVAALRDMKSADDAFKTKLHYDGVLKRCFALVYEYTNSPKDFTTDAAKKILQEIKNALVHRLLFAVRQRRFVTHLENRGLLANSAMAWEGATSELRETSNSLWTWHTKRLIPLLNASLAELNGGMKNDNFDSGLRRLLTQELNRELFWTWLSEKSIVSHCGAIVKALAANLPSCHDASDYDSDDEEEEEEEEV